MLVPDLFCMYEMNLAAGTEAIEAPSEYGSMHKPATRAV
jgi:hypothetical protein